MSYCCISFSVLQSFILTFLAEWGDRSQIATIAVSLFSLPEQTIGLPGKKNKNENLIVERELPAIRGIYSFIYIYIYLQLATHKSAVGVAVGATIGHTICTSVAVVGGSMLASKISQRTVATVGGLLFLGFSLSSYFYPPL